jgi:hypothetical protein
VPQYEFRAADGEERLEFYPVGDAPHLGEWVDLAGKQFQRIIEPPQLANDKGTQNFRLHSNAAPNKAMVDNWERQARRAQAKGIDIPLPARAPAYDEYGRAVFRSSEELSEYCKRDGRYAVGNPREVCQETRKATREHLSKRDAEVAQREHAMKIPEVK